MMNIALKAFLKEVGGMQYKLANAECTKLQRQARRARERGLDNLAHTLEVEASSVFADGLRQNFLMVSYEYIKLYKYAFRW